MRMTEFGKACSIAVFLFSFDSIALEKRVQVSCGSTGIGNETIRGKICLKSDCGLTNLVYDPGETAGDRNSRMKLIRSWQGPSSLVFVAEVKPDLAYVFSVEGSFGDGRLTGEMSKIRRKNLIRVSAACQIDSQK
jgi:hypothetical protein